MMKATIPSMWVALTVVLSGCATDKLHPFPPEITSLTLGTKKTVVTGRLARAGFPCRTTWIGHDPHEVVLPVTSVSNGIESVRIEFAGGTISQITIDIDHDKIREQTAALLQQAWLRDRVEQLGLPFLASEHGGHHQTFWFTTNAAFEVTKIWRCLHNPEEPHSLVSTSWEPLTAEELAWRVPRLVAEFHLATNDPRPNVVWSKAATKLRTNNPEITKLQKHMRERAARRKANAEGPSGPLGSATNPIRCDGPKGERSYLHRLRDGKGRIVSFSRSGSYGDGPYGNTIDGYKVKTGKGEIMVFMDMYHTNFVETNAVPGLTLNEK